MSEHREKKRSLFERTVRFVNVLVLFALVASYAGGSISPERFWPLAFVAMAYPLILVLTAIFTVYWLLKRHWFLYLNLALLLLKWNYVLGSVQIRQEKAQASEESVRVMSFNVRLYDLFKWNADVDLRSNIIELITDNRPDIICIQEHYGGKENEQELLRELKKTGKTYQIHSKNYFAQKKNIQNFGIATITAFPIINSGTIILENSRDALAIYTDLLIKNDTVRVYNVHLQSILLGKEGYRVLNELIDNQEIGKIDDGKLMVSRLKSGFIKRGSQAEKIAKHIQATEHPVILCGDFNDVPTSYAYQTLKRGLIDGFEEAGNGFGATYVPVPFFRIDNILVSQNMNVINHTTHNKQALSDHFAVSAEIDFAD